MVVVEKAILEMITLWNDFMGMSKGSTPFHRVDFLVYHNGGLNGLRETVFQCVDLETPYGHIKAFLI